MPTVSTITYVACGVAPAGTANSFHRAGATQGQMKNVLAQFMFLQLPANTNAARLSSVFGVVTKKTWKTQTSIQHTVSSDVRHMPVNPFSAGPPLRREASLCSKRKDFRTAFVGGPVLLAIVRDSVDSSRPASLLRTRGVVELPQGLLLGRGCRAWAEEAVACFASTSVNRILYRRCNVEFNFIPTYLHPEACSLQLALCCYCLR